MPRRTLMVYRDQGYVSDTASELIKIVRTFTGRSTAPPLPVLTPSAKPAPPAVAQGRREEGWQASWHGSVPEVAFTAVSAPTKGSEVDCVSTSDPLFRNRPLTLSHLASWPITSSDESVVRSHGHAQTIAEPQSVAATEPRRTTLADGFHLASAGLTALVALTAL